MGFWGDLGSTLYSGEGGLLGTGIGGKGGALGTGILGTGKDNPNSTEVGKALIQQSDQNSQQLYEQALAAAAGAQNIQGPAAVTAGGVYVPGIEASDPRFATQAAQAQAFDASAGTKSYDAALAEAADATARMRKAGVTDMAAVNPAYVSAVNTNVEAPNVGPAAQTGAVGVERVSMDPLANQLRSEQIKAAQGIATAPSAAMSQFRAGESQVMSDALAAAAGARGSDRAGARRDALLAINQGGAQQNLSAAALAAQEEQQKRVASATALSSIRSQDVISSQAAAGIQAQQANLQAQIDQAIATGNTEAVNTLKQQQANLALEARKAELSGSLSQQSTQAGLEQANLQARLEASKTNAAAANQAEQAYAQAVNTAGQQTAQNQTNVSLQNAAAQTGAAKDYAGAYNQAFGQYAQNQTQINAANAAAKNASSESNAGRQVDLAKTNTATSLAQQTTNAGNQLEASKATAGNQLSTEQLKQQTLNSGLQTGISANETQAKNAQALIGSAQADQQVKQQQQAGVLGALGSVISAVKSDERVKEDIAPIGGDSPSSRRKRAEEQAHASGSRADRIEAEQAGKDEMSYLLGRANFTDLPKGERLDASQNMWDRLRGNRTSDERAKREISPVGGGYERAFADYAPEDKEDAKREASALTPQQIDDWAAHLQPITYRYKPGVEDGGAEPHVGLSANEVESSGPLGKLMVSHDAHGVRSLDYGAAALMLGKAAFEKASAAYEAATRRAR
jgi:hypothetical protein